MLLGFPLNYPMNRAVRRKDLEIYEDAVRPTGPAMTWSMHAIGWAELEEWGRAEVMFNKSYQPYVKEPFKVTALCSVVKMTKNDNIYLHILISGFTTSLIVYKS